MSPLSFYFLVAICIEKLKEKGHEPGSDVLEQNDEDLLINLNIKHLKVRRTENSFCLNSPLRGALYSHSMNINNCFITSIASVFAN